MNNLFIYISTIVVDDIIRTRFLCDKDHIVIEYAELKKLCNKYNDVHCRFLKKLYNVNLMVIEKWLGTDGVAIGEWTESRSTFLVWALTRRFTYENTKE